MLDDFEDLDSSAFLEDLEVELEEEFQEPAPERKPRRSRSSGGSSGPERRIMGMTAMQRMVISAMFFGMVCIMGFFFMIVTQKMTLAF